MLLQTFLSKACAATVHNYSCNSTQLQLRSVWYLESNLGCIPYFVLRYVSPHMAFAMCLVCGVCISLRLATVMHDVLAILKAKQAYNQHGM